MHLKQSQLPNWCAICTISSDSARERSGDDLAHIKNRYIVLYSCAKHHRIGAPSQLLDHILLILVLLDRIA